MPKLFPEVIRGKKTGVRDRVTILPDSLRDALHAQLALAKSVHTTDLKQGFGRVYLPFALTEKYKNADREWGWQFVFPAATLSRDPLSATVRQSSRSRVDTAESSA